MTDRTTEVLAQMLREDTGIALLDSGSKNERHWQINQSRDIENEDGAMVRFRYGGIEFVHHLFAWLEERLEFDEEANGAFDDAFLKEVDPEDRKYPGELREAFPAWFARWKSIEETRRECSGCEGAGVVDGSDPNDRTEAADRGEGDDEDHVIACPDCNGSGVLPGKGGLYKAAGFYGKGKPVAVNTANEQNLLDQEIQFTYFELAGAGDCGYGYVVLQVHGGADTRGAYTKPRVFRLSPNQELGVFDYREGTIYCENDASDHYWWTDDGYRWYREASAGLGAKAQLETYEHVRLVAEGEAPEDDEVGQWREGIIVVTGDDEGLCPVCGGKLLAG